MKHLGWIIALFFVQVLNLLDIEKLNILMQDGEAVQSLRCEVKSLSSSTTAVWERWQEMPHVHLTSLQVRLGWSLLLKEGRRNSTFLELKKIFV